MPLWSDLIDPETITGYARASMADYEERRGTLARYLPYREIADIVARFVKGQTGLIDAAKFRAYDAAPEVGRRQPGKRVTLELPALGQTLPVTEYEQLRLRSADVSDEQAIRTVQVTTTTAVRAIADAIEYLRGITLATGKATIDQDNFQSSDDFGRPPEHQVVAPTLWSDLEVSRLDYLQTLVDVYRENTGEEPGSLLMGTRVFRAMAAGEEFQTQLLNGSARQPSATEVRSIVSGAGLPDIDLYDRRVSVDGNTRRVLPDDLLLMLPAPVDPNDFQGTELGATWWGRTLTATDPAWEILDADQPGVVVGVWRNDRPPMGLEVISDAIGLPVLANAELSLAAKVL